MNKIHKFSFHVAQTISSIDVQLSPLLQCQWRLHCVHEELRSRINSGIAYYDSVQNLFKQMCHKCVKTQPYLWQWLRASVYTDHHLVTTTKHFHES